MKTVVILLLVVVAVFSVLLLLRRKLHRSLAPERLANRLIVNLPGWRRLRVPTRRGRFLSAWLYAQSEAAPVLVAIHGWGGNADSLLPLAEPLHRAGYAVVLFDARCHGDSDEDDFASLPRFAEDLEAVLDALRGEPSIDARRIAVFGHSVGAGAAMLAASRRPDIAALVSLSAFAHPAEMMQRWLAGRGIRSAWVITGLLAYVQRVIGFRFDDIAPLRSIARIRCPVMLLHGQDDAMVPADDARRLFTAAGRPDVRLHLVPGRHDEFEDVGEHTGRIVGFLDAALAQPR